MSLNSEKNPFSSDMALDSIPETDYEPDFKWTDSQPDSAVTVSQEEWNEWMRKNMTYRASLNLPGDKRPPRTFTDPEDSHLQDSSAGLGDFHPQDQPTDPEDPHSQDSLSNQGNDAERLPEAGKSGSGQSDSTSQESRDEAEQSGLSKGVMLLLVLIVIQLIVILIILCRKKGIILTDAENVFAFCPDPHHVPQIVFSVIGERAS